MMKKIELSSSQFVFVLEKLPEIKERLSKNNSFVIISLKDDEIEIILEHLANLFSIIGLQEDSEPNATGYFIENIIDDFNRALYQNTVPSGSSARDPDGH
jgi:exopolysaccharide biosynthesis predicted pyruvyltransferase EpsI